MGRAVGAILAKDLRRTLRSGFFLLVGIATPLALAFVFSLVFGGVDSGSLRIPVGLVEPGAGAPAQRATAARLGATLEQLEGAEVVELTRLAPGTDPARAIEDDDLAAVAVPGAGRIEVVTAPDAPTSGGIAGTIVRQIAREQDRGRIAATAAAELGVATGAGAAALPAAVTLVAAPEGERGLDTATALSAGLAILFVFIVALLGVAGILHERDEGTLARLLSAPIPRASVLVAKSLVSLLLALVALTVLWAASTLLMGADWGPAAGVAALVVAVAAAALGLTLLIAGSASTIDAAAGVQSTVAVVLALVGGAMIPLPDGGPIGALSQLSPHRWFLHGLDALGGDAAWTAALPSAAVLFGYALVLGLPGAWMLLRRLTP